MKKGLIIGGAAALLVAAFAAGTFLGPLAMRSLGLGGVVALGGPAAPGGAFGPMSQLSDEERAQVQNMSDSERRQFFQERMGDAAPGTAGTRGRSGATIEGTVLEVADDQMTVQTAQGGSQTVYLDSDTVMAYAKDAEQADLAEDDAVIVVAQPEGDNVLAATAIIVK